MNRDAPIFLYTDYGHNGPYVGLLHAVATEHAGPIFDLQHDAPRFKPYEAGVLLQALVPSLPEGSIIVSVIDPTVGSKREGVAVSCDGNFFIGPDNGLLCSFIDRADKVYRLPPVDDDVPASFHGRDWFMPMAMHWAKNPRPGWQRLFPADVVRCDAVPSVRVIYIDAFGNVMTDMTTQRFKQGGQFVHNGNTIPQVRTFNDVPAGEFLSYRNSLGLIEIAINQGNAAQTMAVSIGDVLTLAE
jgi:S-adenosylmethionine hydrolase